jgi:hypothetical protein
LCFGTTVLGRNAQVSAPFVKGHAQLSLLEILRTVKIKFGACMSFLGEKGPKPYIESAYAQAQPLLTKLRVASLLSSVLTRITSSLAASTEFARAKFALFTPFLLTFLVACGGGSSSPPPPPSSSVFGPSSLSGTYVFSSTGLNLANGSPFLTMVGSLTSDGKGDITKGTVDIVEGSLGISSPAAQPITGGSYSVGTDGRGQIKFDTTTQAGAITITLDFVLITSSHGLVAEFDSSGTGSGTIDLQSAVTQSQLAGSYAFAASGTTANGASPTAIVGDFTLSSTGAISSGQEDVNNAGSYSGAPSQILTTSFVNLGTTPAKATIASSEGTSYTFDVYPIDSGHLKFVESDSLRLVSGDVFTQGSSVPTGQLVFALTGRDTNGLPLDSGGWLTSSSPAITAGLQDYNDAGSVGQAKSVSGGISAVSGGRSVLSLSGLVNGAASNTPGSYKFAAYPFTLNGSTGIELLEVDGLGVTSGAAYAQTSTTLATSQDYGLNLSVLNLNEVGVKSVVAIEEDGIAQFGTNTSGLSGTVDLNTGGGMLSLGKTLTGTFPAPVDSNGRGTVAAVPFNFDFYVVDSSSFLLLVTGTQIGTGIFTLEDAASSSSAVASISPLHQASHVHAPWQRQ